MDEVYWEGYVRMACGSLWSIAVRVPDVKYLEELVQKIQIDLFIMSLFSYLNNHKRHSIAHPHGWAMEWLLWVQSDL